MMRENAGRDEIFYKIGHDFDETQLIDELNQLDDVNVVDNMGLSYLHIATISHKVNIIKVLLEKGANPNCIDQRGKTPLSYAIGLCYDSNVEILRTFLKYGADLNMMMGDLTIRERIYEFGDKDLIDVLKEYKL